MSFFGVLDKSMYGVSVTGWLLVLGIVVATYLVLTLVQRWMKHRVGKFAASTATSWDDLVVDIISRTRWFFLLVLSLEAGARAVTLNSTATGALRAAMVIASLLQAGVWANGIITFFAERYTRLKTDGDVATRATVYAIGFAARIALWIVLVITGLDYFGIKVTALIAGLGIGGVAVALAAQNILGDLFAALAIVLDRPFVLGDFIIVGDMMGSVEHIGLKTTRIRSLSGEQIAVANSELLKGRIRNYGRMNERRVVFTVDVTYDTSPKVVAEIPAMIRGIIEAQPKTRFDRSHFSTFAASSLQVETVYYVLDRDYNVYANTQHAINLAILTRFNAEHIEFAFPSRTVYVKGGAERVDSGRT